MTSDALALEKEKETIISADPGTRLAQALRDLWEYRELFFAFVARDIKVRYKQTALGVAWVVLQPLVTGVVFAAAFGLASGRLAGMGDVLFYLAGLVPWVTFQNGVSMAAGSLETNANLVSKVYFPRIVVPGAHILGALVDFVISFAVLVVLALVVGKLNATLFLLVLPLLLIQTLAAIGIGCFLAALNAQYRDVRYAIPFLMQTAMFLTALVPLERWLTLGDKGTIIHTILSFNPMTAVVETFRAAATGGTLAPMLIAKGALVAVLLFVAGVRFFAAREKKLVDIL